MVLKESEKKTGKFGHFFNISRLEMRYAVSPENELN